MYVCIYQIMNEQDEVVCRVWAWSTKEENVEQGEQSKGACESICKSKEPANWNGELVKKIV